MEWSLCYHCKFKEPMLRNLIWRFIRINNSILWNRYGVLGYALGWPLISPSKELFAQPSVEIKQISLESKDHHCFNKTTDIITVDSNFIQKPQVQWTNWRWVHMEWFMKCQLSTENYLNSWTFLFSIVHKIFAIDQ